MIDSSALLLTIVLTTPAEYHDEHNQQNYANIHSLDVMMQRLCWPHAHTMNLECQTKDSTASHNNESDKSLSRALNTFNSMHRR